MSGVPTTLAKRFASLEALGRANAALVIGIKAAKAGHLVLAEGSDGSIKFFLHGCEEKAATRTSVQSPVKTNDKAPH